MDGSGNRPVCHLWYGCNMMPSWLWTLILLLIVAPIHYLVVEPAVDTANLGIRLSVVGGYLALGLLWAIAGHRLRLVRQ
jgi:hypothetical protein